MLDQRQRRWADVVQMLYKCFVFAGMVPADNDIHNTPYLLRLQLMQFVYFYARTQGSILELHHNKTW